MFEIIDYSEKAIAVVGDTKSVKDELKSLGGRFNPRLSCGAGWIFSKKARETVEALLNGNVTVSAERPKAKKASDEITMSAELKEEIRQAYNRMYSHKDGEDSYSYQELSNAVKLSDGKIVVMSKRRIKTRFCFGEHGYDYEEKQELAHRAATDETYFLAENLDYYDTLLKRINRTAEELPNCYGCSELKNRICIQRETTCYTHEGNLWNLTNQWFGSYDGWEQVDKMRKGEHPDLCELKREDLELVKKLVLTERAKFEKRLRTYLKRYGTSKLHTWTYWADR